MAITNLNALSESPEHGDQRAKLPVIGSSGTTSVSGNLTITRVTHWPDLPARELFISNDNAADMTITVNCVNGTLSWLIHTGETFNERLPPFNNVVVTATGNWRWYVRGNLS